MMPNLIVFSHLRWNFVYQRPQHLLSRLAKEWKVWFVEEPMKDEGEPFLERIQACDNVEVLRPHTPHEAPGFHDDQLPALGALVERFIAEERIRDYAVWFYTPMALPLLQALEPVKVIYDCMDELSHFRNAPKQLLQRENALMKIADVVFTGGPSLYRAKKDRHPNVHCFPSSVDAAHFAPRGEAAGDAVHPGIPHPRIGFFGVIDERLDPELVAAVADADPSWQVVMVGPVVKIDPGSLPERPNLHWMGPREYRDLPSFAAGWDVCMMPFALNESTKFISPTKTLEYMAAGRPVVSTPITDVVDPYSHVVEIAATPTEFVDACRRLLAEDGPARQRRARAMQDVVETTSWDATARAMADLMRTASPAARSEAAEAVLAPGVMGGMRRTEPVTARGAVKGGAAASAGG